ncbi:MAG TPA: outer membrane protein assembly factor BamC [Leucothrix mucor]|nr:outer membrane protein assembly factor BamC [Leucothrix mucor]
MKNIIVTSSVLALLSGCAAVDKLTDTTGSINYKNSSSVKTLEFPPDLTSPEFDHAFIMPSSGGVRASTMRDRTFSSDRNVDVLPASTNMRMGGNGNVRWLDVDAPANSLWSQMRDFWRSLGVDVIRDEPRIGLMETEWAENRAGLPNDWLRSALGSVLKGMFDAGTRDQFRIRVERPSANKTRIYLTHKGSEKIVTETGVGWELRPPKHELEAEMLNRLQAFLQGDKYSATKNTNESDLSQSSSLVSLVTEDGSSVLQVHEAYNKAWVRTGIMLERMGLSVESRKQSQGIYGVLYNGGEAIENKGGFFSRLFKGKQTFLTKGSEYQIHIRDAGRLSEVKVMDEEGVPLSVAESQKILSRLKQEFDR